MADTGRVSPCNLSLYHVPSSPLPINKEQGDRSTTKMKIFHSICDGSNSPIHQPAPRAVFWILDDVVEMEGARLREQTTGALPQSSAVLLQKECTRLRKKFEDVLIRLMDVSQNHWKKHPVSGSNNKNALLKFSTYLKHREQYITKCEVLENEISLSFSYHILMYLQASARHPQMFLSKFCLSSPCHYIFLNCGILSIKVIAYL